MVFINLSAKIFEIELEQYLTYMSSLLVLDLGNNYVDDRIQKNLSDLQLEDLDENNIPWFDNWSPLQTDKKIKDYSDYTNWLTIAGSIYLLSDRDFATNYLVMGEVMLAQSVLGKWTKTISARGRPYTYDEFNSNSLRNNKHSFYSLHASSAFAAARVGYFYYTQKGGDNVLIPIFLYSGAIASALLRVFAGQHFTSDVVVGAIMGTFIADQLIKIHSVKPLDFDLRSDYIGLSYKF